MQVQLDEVVWEMADTMKLEEVLAHLSDTAHQRGCLVTNLVVGNKVFTDRDLLPTILSQEAGMFGNVTAKSQPLQSVVDAGATSAQKFGGDLRSDGHLLVKAFRQGEQRFRQLDEWFGRLADYVEWMEIARSTGAPHAPTDSLVDWVQEVVGAREREDTVRLADLLEFEVIPRLPAPAGS